MIEPKEVAKFIHIHVFINISLCVYIIATGFPGTCEVFALTPKIKIKHQLSDRLVKCKFEVLGQGRFSKTAVL